jgi:hypothetical protein
MIELLKDKIRSALGTQLVPLPFLQGAGDAMARHMASQRSAIETRLKVEAARAALGAGAPELYDDLAQTDGLEPSSEVPPETA